MTKLKTKIQVVGIILLPLLLSACLLVKIKTSVWIVNLCLDLAARHAEWNGEFNEEFEFDWRAIKDLGQLGPGLLVEVEAEEEEVLIWLQ